MERIAEALLTKLIELGVLDTDDVSSIADAIENDGDSGSAHQVRCCLLDAEPKTSTSDYQAEQRRRSTMRLVTPDGGNRED